MITAILRLNDGKIFALEKTADRLEDKLLGFINEEKKLQVSVDESEYVRKHFDLLYTNHLQFMGKVIEAQKQQKVIKAGEEAKSSKFEVSQKTQELAEKHRQKVAGTGAAPNWKEEAKLLVEAKELKECTFQPNVHRSEKEEPKLTSAQTVERLYGMRKPQIDKTDKAREDYEFERMGSECTFKPKRLTQEMPIRSKN